VAAADISAAADGLVDLASPAAVLTLAALLQSAALALRADVRRGLIPVGRRFIAGRHVGTFHARILSSRRRPQSDTALGLESDVERRGRRAGHPLFTAAVPASKKARPGELNVLPLVGSSWIPSARARPSSRDSEVTWP
jgi:hypothetical protein